MKVNYDDLGNGAGLHNMPVEIKLVISWMPTPTPILQYSAPGLPTQRCKQEEFAPSQGNTKQTVLQNFLQKKSFFLIVLPFCCCDTDCFITSLTPALFTITTQETGFF